MKQEIYMEMVARRNYQHFLQQGFADAGHNGPHGHKDTPVRNTSHYLIIYTYLYKKYREKENLEICSKFADYLCKCQAASSSGAIQCMESSSFDHLNGLIGQAWVIEALLYYYDVSRDEKCLSAAKILFFTQQYDYKLHLWRRIELDGSDIGVDPTYNHQVWFAACASTLMDYCNDPEIDCRIRDFLNSGAVRDFITYPNGLLHHSIHLKEKAMIKIRLKRLVKLLLLPVKNVNPRKLDVRYMEYAYHIFDLYGFSILKERFGNLPLFSSKKYQRAVCYAENIDQFNRNCGANNRDAESGNFNIFGYSYNSPAFEYPYVAISYSKKDEDLFDQLYKIQEKLMFDTETGMFTRNNPDIDTWNARTYEIIRYCES